MAGVDWPGGWDRTPANERDSGYKFDAGLGQTTTELVDELDRMGVDDWRVSFGNQHRKSNGMPRHDANPDDPGFVLRWTKDGTQYAVACDAYRDLSANVRSVYLWLNETRLRGQRPVQTGEDEFAAARLPSGDDDVVVADGTITPAHEVLGVQPDATEQEIKQAYRQQLKEKHPDQGGTRSEFRQLQQAKRSMLNRVQNDAHGRTAANNGGV